MKIDISHSYNGVPTCSVLQVKSDCSSPQTLSAATTSTMTRKINSTDSQILPKLVEWRLAPTNWLYRAGQDILGKQSEAWEEEEEYERSYQCEKCFFLYQVRLLPLNYTSDSNTDGNWEGRPWQKMKADETKQRRRRGWKGMKVRGGGEEAQRQHSCELMNLSAHCGLYWTKPTLNTLYKPTLLQSSPHHSHSTIDWLIYRFTDHSNHMHWLIFMICMIHSFKVHYCFQL